MITDLPNFESGYAEVKGTNLYYEASGEGAPLLLVHGFSLDRRMWDPQFALLSETHRVIRYDSRGHGMSSDAPVAPYYHPDDLLGLMDALEIDQAHLVGLSMGGATIVDFAAEHPERVRSLVPVDAPLGGMDWSTDFPSRIGVAAKLANEEGIEAALKPWMEDDLLAPAMGNPGCAPALREIVGGYTGWHWTSGAQGQSRETPTIDLLGGISAPTTVIVGELDLIDFITAADIMSENIPNANKAVLRGVGHMSNMEDPDGFNDVLTGFLAGVD